MFLSKALSKHCNRTYTCFTLIVILKVEMGGVALLNYANHCCSFKS